MRARALPPEQGSARFFLAGWGKDRAMNRGKEIDASAVEILEETVRQNPGLTVGALARKCGMLHMTVDYRLAAACHVYEEANRLYYYDWKKENEK